MPRRARRRSWGSVTEVQRGKRYIVRWMENTDAGRKRRSKTLRCTAAEASRFLAMKEVEHGTERRTPTFGEVYAMWYRPWLERRADEGRIKASTALRYMETWEKLCSDRWAKTPIDRLRPAEFQEWLLGQNRGNANISIVVMRKMLDISLRNDAVEVNVLRRDYDLPVATTRSKDLTVYGIAEAIGALAAVRGTLAEAPFILSCFGGCRVGESLGVRVDEVARCESDGVAFAAVPIERRMLNTGGLPLPDGDLKTPQSRRTALVPEPYCERLFEIIAERHELGTVWLADRGDGLPLNKNSYMYRFREAVGDSAIPLSNLRSSWRTFAEYEWEVPADTLEQLMGHVLPGVSGKHYIRPSLDDLMHSFAVPYRAHIGAS